MRMNKLLILSLMAIMCLAGFMVPAAYGEDRDVSIWLFDEGTGSTAACLPDNVNQAELRDGASWSSATPDAYSSSCVTLDGINDWVFTPAYTSSWRQVSVEAWVYVNAFDTEQTIVANDPADGTSPWAGFELYVDGNKLALYIQAEQVLWADTTLETQTWTHVAFTYDHDGYGINTNIYVNGQLGGSRVCRGTILWTNLVSIGRSPTGPREFLNGKIDEVKLYHGVLSHGQIKKNGRD